MSKFNSIEIAELVALHPKVETHRFFGLFERVSYQPTHSKIESFRNYYGAHEADLLQKIAESDDPEVQMSSAKEIHVAANGNYRLDICLSKDCKFVAFQVFQRQHNEFVPFSRLCILEGDQAKAFEELLA